MTPLPLRRITDAVRHRARSCILAFALVASALFSSAYPARAILNNGENAIDILGEFTSPSSDTTGDYVKNCVNNGASSIGFNSPNASALDATNHLLYVVDNNNNRVLVFTLNSSNVISSKTAANVLGQPDMVSCAATTTPATQSGMNGPTYVAVDPVNQRLFVADYGNSRVLVFNTSSISNGMNASYVLGQSSFTAYTCGTSQSTMCNPLGLAYDSTNTRLFVSDAGNNRVLVLNVAPGTIANGENASYELGQPSGVNAFNTTGNSLTQSGMNGPTGLAYDSTNTRLFVGDTNYNRVTVFNVATGTIANGENASNVLGASNFTTHNLTVTQSTLGGGPEGLDYDSANTRLFVTDTGDSRVMIFNVATGTIADGENASNELGQPSGASAFTSSTAATTQSGMNAPLGVTYDSTNNQVYVEDGTNNRVTLYSTSSVTNGENASDLLGEYNSPSSTSTVVYTQNGPNNGPTALGFNTSSGIALDAINHNLYVSDNTNNRVLVYTLNSDNSIPTSSGGHTASYVLGQTSLQGANGFASTQSGLKIPRGLAVDGANQRLFVVDNAHNRVLVFNTSSITNGMNASYVLGQPNFTTVGAATTQAKMNYPRCVAYDAANNRLFVAEYLNNRVTVWNVAPGSIANGENASYVLGQSSFTTNGTATTQSGMDEPDGVAYDATNNRLFVADTQNNRVLVFNVAPGTVANGENASYELGQPSGVNAFTTSASAATQSGMTSPYGLTFDVNNNRLFVGEAGNRRVTVFNVAPTVIANGMNAAYVVGQTNFTGTIQTTTQSGFRVVWDVLYDPSTTHLFVSDENNNRVMIFDGTALPSADYYLP